ncbi:MAG TPA: tripartite tricarboxylate transporter substrate binding protein [Usitatibacter sp.]|nr:tripartite tricarboxylate transporter substrate binding protein [Usitatibacter sp.]HXS51359.1 tripartite tricarboxylate transporter substrate binding protein [Usitatibacter sp.]
MHRIVACIVACIALVSGSAFGAYPERPVKLIVPWGAGGDTDVIYRALLPFFQKHLGGTVIIANIGGASGTKGAKEAKDSPPDGYTIFAVHDSIHSTYWTGVADVDWTDFEPICLVSSTPSILTASPKAPWKDVKSMIADAKKRPGQITVAATLGSTSHFFPALIEKATGIKFKYVPYEGTADRMNALLGSHVDLGESNLTQKGKADAGHIRFLAIATEQRAPEIPNVPTLKEEGVDVEYAVNRGLLAPKGTPAPVLAKLRSACGAAVNEAGFAKAMKLQGTNVHYLNAEQYTDFLKKNDKLNHDLAQSLGLLKR